MIRFAPNRMSGRAPVQVFLGAAFLFGTYSAPSQAVEPVIQQVCTMGQYVDNLTTTGQYVNNVTTTGQYVSSVTITGLYPQC